MTDNVDFISNPKNAFWQFTTPLLLLTLFEAGYSFVDVFWVSQMNPESFFAIGVTVPILTLIVSFGRSLGIGTNSIMSREMGDNNLIGSYNSILHILFKGYFNICWRRFFNGFVNAVSESYDFMSVCFYLF